MCINLFSVFPGKYILVNYSNNNINNKYKMISRRRILSRSRDELENIEEEDVWYQRDALFKVSPPQLSRHTYFSQYIFLNKKKSHSAKQHAGLWIYSLI